MQIDPRFKFPYDILNAENDINYIKNSELNYKEFESLLEILAF